MVNVFERRARDLVGSLSGTAQAFDVACALVFLHALSSPAHPAGPPPGLHWEALASDPDPATVKRALKLVEDRENGLLDGMAQDLSALDDLPASALAGAMRCVEALSRASQATSQPADAFGSLYMVTSGLSAQQARGQFYTPGPVASLLAAMLDGPMPGQWVLDDACGTGGLLLAAIEHARATLGEPFASSITFIGVELSARSSRLARMNLALAAAGHQAHVFAGDSLAQVVCAHDSDGELREVRFDRILANPPFGKVRTAATAGSPLLIPDRLLNRPVVVPGRDAA